MHPLQGASFLGTPLQGGILKPPALRVVDDLLPMRALWVSGQPDTTGNAGTPEAPRMTTGLSLRATLSHGGREADQTQRPEPRGDGRPFPHQPFLTRQAAHAVVA